MLRERRRAPGDLQPPVVAAAKGGATLAGWIADWIAGLFGEEFVAEIRGIARHGEPPLAQLVLGDLVYDIMQWGGIPGVGCSHPMGFLPASSSAKVWGRREQGVDTRAGGFHAAPEDGGRGRRDGNGARIFRRFSRCCGRGENLPIPYSWRFGG